MFFKHLQKGCLLALLFLFSSSAFSFEWEWAASMGPLSNCQASADIGNASGPPFYKCSPYSYDPNGYNLLQCNDSAATSAGSACGDGLDTLCENRAPIISDNEGPGGYSYQGCNYNKCGSIVDADAGTYNVSYCPQPGACSDSFLGCKPENPFPYSDDLDDGCMVKDGQSICIDESDPDNCYVVDGEQQCFEENSICGVKNGTMQCVKKEEDNCGTFNGDTVCFDPNSEEPKVIDENSPDDPDNGGNGDGDETNDVADSRTTEEGGDANNQPTDNNLSNKDKKQSKLDAQNITNEMLKKGMWEREPAGTGITDQVTVASDGVSDGLFEMGTDIVDGVVSGGDGFGQSSALTGLQNNVLSPITVGGACSSIPLVIPGGFGTYYIDCFYLDKTRQFLSFLFYISTIIGLFYILTRPMESR